MMKYETEIDFDSRNVMTLLIDLIENHSKILEFGPASGRLTKYLKETKSCEMWIVEIDEEAARAAIPYAKDFVIGDIMEYEWLEKFSGQCFDYILFADVLEHLQRPEEVLRYAKELLKDHGKVLVSLPNIAYNGVLASLYHNVFQYRETGILDQTHLHFWTSQEAVSMFERCGYGAKLVDAVYQPLKNSEFSLQYDTLPCVVADAVKSRAYGEAYQLVFLLAKGRQAETVQKLTSYTGYYFIQTFTGRGNDWEDYEEHSIPVDLTKEICFQTKISRQADRFRLDPLNAECVAKVVVTDQSGAKLQAKDANGMWVGNVFCFDHKDPQIIYDVSEGIKTVKVKIRFLIYHQKEIYQWICQSMKEQSDRIEQKEDYIGQQRKYIEICEQKLCERNGIIEQKENYICEQRKILNYKDKKIREQHGTIEQKENYICEQRKMIEEKEIELHQNQEKLKEYNTFINRFGIRQLYHFYKKRCQKRVIQK